MVCSGNAGQYLSGHLGLHNKSIEIYSWGNTLQMVFFVIMIYLPARIFTGKLLLVVARFNE